MVSLVVKLMAVVKETAEQIREHEELAVNGQTALYSLKVLCRHIGDRHPDIFIEVKICGFRQEHHVLHIIYIDIYG